MSLIKYVLCTLYIRMYALAFITKSNFYQSVYRRATLINYKVKNKIRKIKTILFFSQKR